MPPRWGIGAHPGAGGRRLVVHARDDSAAASSPRPRRGFQRPPGSRILKDASPRRGTVTKDIGRRRGRRRRRGGLRAGRPPRAAATGRSSSSRPARPGRPTPAELRTAGACRTSRTGASSPSRTTPARPKAPARPAARRHVVADAVRGSRRGGGLRRLGGARQPRLELRRRPAGVPAGRGGPRVRRQAVARRRRSHPDHALSGPRSRRTIHAAALEAFDAPGFPRIEDHNAPDAVGSGPMPMSSRDGVRVTTADAYLPAGRRPPTDRPLRLTGRDGRRSKPGRATASGSPTARWSAADLVVLAAGVYGSPPILMRSGVGPADHLVAARHPGPRRPSGRRREPGRPPRRRPRLAAGAAPATAGPILHSIATFRSSTAPTDAAGPDVLGHRSGRRGARLLVRSDPAQARARAARSGSDRPIPRPRPASRSRVSSEPRDVERLIEGYRLGSSSRTSPRSDASPRKPRRPSRRRRRHGAADRRERLLDPACRRDVRDGTVTRARRRRRRRRPGPWRRAPVRRRRVDHARTPRRASRT